MSDVWCALGTVAFMSAAPGGGPASKRKRLFRRDSGGGPSLPPVPRAIVGIAVGLTLAIGGGVIAFGSTAPESPLDKFPVVPFSDVMGALDSGALESINVDAVSAAGSAELASDVSAEQVDELFGPDSAVDGSVSFLVPPSVQPLLAEEALAAGVPLQFSSARVAGAAPRAPTTATSVMGAVPSSAVSESSSSQPSGWIRGLGVFMLLGGLFLLVFSIGSLWTSHRDRATAPLDDESRPSTRFADVAGADEAVEQMRELVDFLAHPEKYRALGAQIPKGALLVGPPGTGKTLLARALAGEAGVPIHSATGSQFVEMYVGVGARRVRDLFKAARKSPAAIVFIDEIDAVARRRSDGRGPQSNTESENTLIALLTEMDGFDEESSVVVIAATNRPDVLDPALTRPGRLDRRIEVPLPDRRGREQILRVHAEAIRMADDVDLELVARRTPGFSGAQLASVVNEAALEAVRRGLPSVSSPCFDASIAGVAMGRARASALVTEHDRRVTAWHEAGHTVSALLLADADPPVAVSIVPRGPAGGVTWMAGSDDQFLSRAKAHARLVVALSGRAAERLLLNGEYTQGAAGDLQSATQTALLMATRYGMTRLGLASREEHLGGTTTKEVAEVVEELLADAHAEATELLREHEGLVRLIADALLECEDLDAEDLRRLALEAGVVPAGIPTPVPVPPQHGSKGVASPLTSQGVADVPAARRSGRSARRGSSRVPVLSVLPWRRRSRA